VAVVQVMKIVANYPGGPKHAKIRMIQVNLSPKTVKRRKVQNLQIQMIQRACKQMEAKRVIMGSVREKRIQSVASPRSPILLAATKIVIR